MKTILETTALEDPDNTYIIDLLNYDEDLYAVEIIQSSTTGGKQRSIKVRSSLLSEMIKVLENYHAKVFNKASYSTKHLSDLEKQKIQDNYLKGVGINNLALQFDQSTELIEMVLRNRGIAIVDNASPKSFYTWRKYYRTRRRNKRKR